MRLSQFTFLADENVHLEVVAFLRERGLDVAVVRDFRDLGLAGSPGSAILAVAFESHREVITHDSDFGRLAATGGRMVHGIVYLRPGHIRPAFTIATLDAILHADLDVRPPFILRAVRSEAKVRIRSRGLRMRTR